jgi:hypothetical protein
LPAGNLASRNHMALRLVAVHVTWTCLPLLVLHASRGVSRPAWPLPWASLTTPPSAVCGRHAWAFIGGRPAVSKTEGRAQTALRTRLLPEETAGDGTQVSAFRCAEACTCYLQPACPSSACSCLPMCRQACMRTHGCLRDACSCQQLPAPVLLRLPEAPATGNAATNDTPL